VRDTNKKEKEISLSNFRLLLLPTTDDDDNDDDDDAVFVVARAGKTCSLLFFCVVRLFVRTKRRERCFSRVVAKSVIREREEKVKRKTHSRERKEKKRKKTSKKI